VRSHHVIGRFLIPGLVFFGMLGLLAAAAPAAEYYLVAKSVDVTMPDGVTVPMWGFALDDDAGGSPGVGDCWESGNPVSAACTGLAATVPGPALSVGSGDSTLTIHLTNLLSAATSIVVPGQELPAGSTPVFFTDGEGRDRVRSFTDEAGAGGQATYEWNAGDGNAFRPGSFFYESGTHPQVQVQMGLYGAVARPSAAGVAYAGVPYDAEVSLLFSEIDPALHEAVDDGSYGTTGPTSTLDYQPRYFLINGQPHDHLSPDPCIDSGAGAGDRILLRMANAGLRELVPMALASHWEVVAEAGNAYPFAREQYSVLLQPGTSKDAVFTPAQDGEYRIVERRLNLTNGVATGGGMQLCLAVETVPALKKGEKGPGHGKGGRGSRKNR